MTHWLAAAEATRALGVNRATLYAYVSRGLVRSEAVIGKTREKRYAAEDIDHLVRRKEERKEPHRAAGTALDWGAPVLESELTLIADGHLFYRGVDAVTLSERATVEEVAGLLWTGDSRPPRIPLHAQLALLTIPDGTLLEAYGHALTHAAARDLQAHLSDVKALPDGAARVLALLYAVTEHAARVPPAPDVALHERLARAWQAGREPAADLLRRALVLTADHELNVSSFTARCVASGGASLHHATLAGLCALQGTRHGLGVEFAFDLLRDAERTQPRVALATASRRQRFLPGFGHQLYPEGDPRARALLRAATATFPDHPVLRASREVMDVARTELGVHPNVDFALALVTHVLGRNATDGVALFALGRTVGWLAHAIEAASTHALIRPRARYVGPTPSLAPPTEGLPGRALPRETTRRPRDEP